MANRHGGPYNNSSHNRGAWPYLNEVHSVNHKFQVHLRGIIELLSKHLYSGPHVYLRELLQNGVDAIRARVGLDPAHEGEITLEILGHGKKGQPTLLFTDNGIGLTEAE